MAYDCLLTRPATKDDYELVAQINSDFIDSLERELRRSHDGSTFYYYDLRNHTDYLLQLLRRTTFEMLEDIKDAKNDTRYRGV